MKRRAGGAEGGLKLVRAKRELRIGTQIHQHWQRQQAAAARDGVHKAGDEAGGKQQRDLPPRDQVKHFHVARSLAAERRAAKLFEFSRSADFQVCCIADFPIRRRRERATSSDLRTPRRFGNRRHSRFGNLRYPGACRPHSIEFQLAFFSAKLYFQQMSLTENQLAHPDQFVRRHIGPDASETRAMLALLGHKNLDDLIDAAVPKKIRLGKKLNLPAARRKLFWKMKMSRDCQ